MGPGEPEGVVTGNEGAGFAMDEPALTGAGPAAGLGVTVTNRVVVAPLTTVVTDEVTSADATAVETGGCPTWRMTSTVRPISTGMA